MTQADILTFLENNRGQWFSIEDIHKSLQTANMNSISSNLKRLRHHGLVKFKFNGKRY